MIATNYFIKRKIQSLAAEAPLRKHASCSLNEAAHILVMYDAAESEQVKPLIVRLKQLKVQVHTCVYCAGLLPEGLPDDALIVDKNKLSVFGFPDATLTETFKAIPADILIDLTAPSDYPMHYLMLLHPSLFKAGFKYSEQSLHDLSVSITDRKDIRQLSDLLLHYLETIHTK